LPREKDSRFRIEPQPFQHFAFFPVLRFFFERVSNGRFFFSAQQVFFREFSKPPCGNTPALGILIFHADRKEFFSFFPKFRIERSKPSDRPICATSQGIVVDVVIGEACVPHVGKRNTSIFGGKFRTLG
jgi:hypothetical protein